MIYFVLPIYNEEKSISALILKLRELMKGCDYKIIAVNDGSCDKSLEVLEKLADSRLTIESYFINMNIGAVFATGIDKVLSESTDDGDILIIMESDQTSEIDLVKELILQIRDKNNDISIASRYKEGGQYLNFPIARRIFSYTANQLLRLYFPIGKIRDYTIFFRAYRIGILREAVNYFGRFGLIQSRGFVANAELLIKLSIFTRRISEIPFVYNYGKKIGESKIDILRTINEYFVLVNYLKHVLKKMKKSDIPRINE